MDIKFKALTYGLMHFAVAVTVTYLLTGSVAAAVSIGVVEPMVQTLAYTVHERLWTRTGHKAGYTAAATRHHGGGHSLPLTDRAGGMP